MQIFALGVLGIGCVDGPAFGIYLLTTITSPSVKRGYYGKPYFGRGMFSSGCMRAR